MVRHFIPKESSLSGLKKNEDKIDWDEDVELGWFYKEEDEEEE